MSASPQSPSAAPAEELVLTPNLRAARQFRARSGSMAAQGGLHAKAWRGWTAELWQTALLAGADGRVLLNDLQTAALWRWILQENAVPPDAAMIDLCVAAQSLVFSYGAREALRRWERHAAAVEDAAQFAVWLRAFQDRCSRERLLCGAGLEAALARCVHEGALAVPQSMRLVGFDHLLPSQRALVQAFADRGAAVVEEPVEFGGSAREDPPMLLQADNEAEELQALASAMRQGLAQPVRPQVLVVVPDLERARSQIDRALRTEIGDPFSVASAGTEPLWEFSSGHPLARIPLARTALLLLRWRTGPLPLEDVSWVLRSPYCGLGTDAEQTAAMDATVLRRSVWLRPELSIGSVARTCSEGYPELADRLHAWKGVASWPSAEHRSYTAWVKNARRILREAGWPGARARTSEEFQTVSRWDAMLDQVATLDLLAVEVSFAGFLAAVETAAASVRFAPQNVGAPIQIVSLEESAGSIAQQVWFLHADEEHWSARRTVHPLLPWSLQEEFAMPGTNASRDLAQARCVARRIARSGAAVTFSHASRNSEGAVRPSSLLDGLDAASIVAEPVPAMASQTVPLEAYTDAAAVPLDSGIVSGGTSVLQQQAACGFRAFAEKRLFASEPEAREFAMDPRDRGNVVHKALQSFWLETKSQDELLRLLREETLDAAIDRAIATTQLAAHARDSWDASYLRLQRKRLHRVLRRWLERESTRPPFHVLATEEKISLRLGPLAMAVRVDRIDEVLLDGDRARVLLDYKTGSPKAESWQGERLEEPQLPAYTLLPGMETVQAIAFACLKPGSKSPFVSFPANSDLLVEGGGSDAAFEDERQLWSERLTRLANAFAEGSAEVAPRQYPVTCRYCGQRLLCRLNPASLEQTDDEDVEATA